MVFGKVWKPELYEDPIQMRPLQGKICMTQRKRPKERSVKKLSQSRGSLHVWALNLDIVPEV